MANPLHKSINEQFVDDNYDQKTWGVQNAQLNKMTADVRAGEAANSSRKPRRRYQNDSLNQYNNIAQAEVGNENYPPPQTVREQRVAERYYQENEELESAQPTQYSTKQKIKTSLSARSRSVAFAGFTLSYSLALWAWLQFPFAILGAGLLGVASMDDGSWTVWAFNQATAIVGWFAGIEQVDIKSLAVVGLLLPAAIGWMTMALSLGIGFFMRLNVLWGNGSAAKIGFWISAIVLYALPLANFFPWIVLWIIAVVIWPK